MFWKSVSIQRVLMLTMQVYSSAMSIKRYMRKEHCVVFMLHVFSTSMKKKATSCFRSSDQALRAKHGLGMPILSGGIICSYLLKSMIKL